MRRFASEEIEEVWEQLRNGQSVRSVAIGLGRYPRAARQSIFSALLPVSSNCPKSKR